MQRTRKYFSRLTWPAMLAATFVCTPLTTSQAQDKKADKKEVVKDDNKKSTPQEANPEEHVGAPAPMTPQDEALMAAVRNGETAQVLKLLDAGANAHGRNRDGWSMLHYAAGGGVPEVVLMLLDRKAEPDTRHKTGVTPLMMAAEAGHLEAVRLLLERGADAALTSKEGHSALDMARAKNRSQVVEVLAPLTKKPNAKPVKPVNNTDDANNVAIDDNDVARERALTDAATKGRTSSVEKLLDQGAKPNSQNQDGWTALALAAKSGYVDTVRALLERGADPNAKHKTGMTALMLAANGGHTQTVEALIEGGADVDEVNKASGESALAMATKHNYAEIIKVLKAAGAKG